jgi:hypothetical protein
MAEDVKIYCYLRREHNRFGKPMHLLRTHGSAADIEGGVWEGGEWGREGGGRAFLSVSYIFPAFYYFLRKKLLA